MLLPSKEKTRRRYIDTFYAVRFKHEFTHSKKTVDCTHWDLWSRETYVSPIMWFVGREWGPSTQTIVSSPDRAFHAISHSKLQHRWRNETLHSQKHTKINKNCKLQRISTHWGSAPSRTTYTREQSHPKKTQNHILKNRGCFTNFHFYVKIFEKIPGKRYYPHPKYE